MLNVSLETNPHIHLLALISRLMVQYMFLFNCWKKKAVLCSVCAGVVPTSEFSGKKMLNWWDTIFQTLAFTVSGKSLPCKVKSLSKPVHFSLMIPLFQDKSYFRCPGAQRTLSLLVLTCHSLQKTSL